MVCVIVLRLLSRFRMALDPPCIREEANTADTCAQRQHIPSHTEQELKATAPDWTVYGAITL